MIRDVFTEAERRYICGFQPAGFVRTWQALYETKCYAGPWTLSRRSMIFGALERGNRWPRWYRTRFEPDIVGWQFTVPLGFGTLALWGYWRATHDNHC